MMEDPATPTFLGLTAVEWHAVGYGLLEGLKFWKRKPVAYADIDTLPLSPEWKADLKAKYHYYWIAFDLPEDIALVALALYFMITNRALALSLAGKFFGIPL
ncbi:MAG: hypothetical protein OS112_03300 [Methanoregula sp.]|nr:MAG: hypothetical protein OS112_03300 [Methanoregula sp.]